MAENTRGSEGRARHSDRGFASARWALGGVVLLVACSGNLMHGGTGTGGTRSSSGDAGVGWVSVGDAGAPGGDAGAGGWNTQGSAGVDGASGTFGGSAGTFGGCSFPFNGPGCPPGNCAAGTGNCGAPSGGTGGGAGSGGTGGTVGPTPTLPACVDGAPSFGVCFVSDADVLPLPDRLNDMGVTTTGAATIVDVGTGAAPSSCEIARVFGTRGTSDWWFKAKAGDNRVWTIGVRGLGTMPPVSKNDSVTLNLSWRGYGIAPGFGGPYGELQVQNIAAMPVLWASADKNTASWVRLTAGAAECDVTALCYTNRYDVVVTINGSTATLPSFGSAILGGYTVAVGQSVGVGPTGPGQCADYYAPALEAGAARLALTAP